MRRWVIVLLVGAAAAQDAVERDLVDDDPAKRLAAADRLGDLGAAAAPVVPLLAEAVFDEDIVVAMAAVDALGRIGPEARGAAGDLRTLDGAQPYMHEMIERALRAMGGGSGGTTKPPAERPDDLVDHPKANIRMPAIWALLPRPGRDAIFLAMLKDPRVRRRRIATRYRFAPASLPELRRALDDADAEVRYGAASAIARLWADAAPALPDLLALLETPGLPDDCVAEIYDCVTRAAPDRALRFLVPQLAADDPRRRAAACRMLGLLGDRASDAVPVLADACFDEDSQVASDAVSALRNLGRVAKAAAPLLAELADANPRAALATGALQAMGGFVLPPPPDPLDLPALRARLGDSDARVAGSAAFAIGRVGATDPETLDALGAALEHPTRYVRGHAFLALVRIGPASVPVLARVVQERRGPARRLAALALPRLAGADPEPVLPVALPLLADADPCVRREAIRTLGIIGPAAREAAPRLLELLDGDNGGLAAWALGRLQFEAAVPRLVKLLDLPRGRDQSAVTWAILAIGEIGAASEAALPALVAEARRPDGTHFSETLTALAGIGTPGQVEIVNLIRDETGMRRCGAIQVLTALDLRPPGFKEAVNDAVKDDDSYVRQTALLATAAIEAAERRDAAAARAPGPADPKVARWVAAAKAEPKDRYRGSLLPGTLADIATVAELLEVAGQPDAQVRWIAWRALSLKKRAEFTASDASAALPMLIEALGDSSVSGAAAACVHVVPLGAPDARLLRFLWIDPQARHFDFHVAEQVGKAIHDLGPAVVPALVRALGDKDVRVRAGAATVLPGFGSAARDAVPALRLAALDDEKTAQPFVRAILAIADLEAIASLFADPAMPMGEEFASVLVAAGKDAIPYLDALRRSDDPVVRRKTVAILPRCKDVPLEWFLKAAGDEDDAVARMAIARLGRGVPAEKAVPVLVRAAEDEALRAAALPVLASHGEDAMPALRKLAADPSVVVRATTLGALGPAGAPALGLLCEGLADEDPSVRAAAAGSLSQLGDAAGPAVPALRRLLGDKERPVRIAAATTLGQLRVEDAVPDLVKLFGSADQSDWTVAGKALATMGPKGQEALAHFLGHPEKVFRDRARSALARMGAVAAIVALATSDDATGRREAVAFLAAAGAMRPLADALRHKEAPVRLDAAWALGTMKARATPAVPDLIAALDDPDGLVVAQAAWALGQVGPAARDALPALEKLHAARKHTGIVADAIRRIRGS